jgi:branched-chain amino acid transport system ATP-binding protein
VRYQAALHSDIAADLGRRTGLIGALVKRRKRNKMDVVRSLADRIIVLTNGQLVADGEPAAVIASPVVQEAHLGLSPGKAA